MTTSRTFRREVPALEGEIFRIAAGAGLDSSLTIQLENESATNPILYTLQESADGGTWTDKALPLSSGGSQADWTLAANECHTIRLTASSSFYRLLASGNTTAMISLIYRTQVPVAASSLVSLVA